MKRKILISQVYYNNAMHDFLLENHNLVEELSIDSGGFTWWKRGFKDSEDVYYNKYMAKVEKIRELQKYFKVRLIQLDKPLNEEATKKLWDKQKNIPDFYPVFTAGSDLDYLEELAKENKLIYLGGVVDKSNIAIYNYLEPSLSFERKFSDVLNKYDTQIHLLGKSTFDYSLNYVYTMDSCIFNGVSRDPKFHKIRNFFINSKLQKLAINNFISHCFAYCDRITPIKLNKFVFAATSLAEIKISLQAFTEEEQEVFNMIKNHYLNNTIPQEARKSKEDKMQIELF